MSECPICRRPMSSGEKFCEYHSMADINLKAAFEDWKTAMGIEWEDYLKHLIEEEGTGKWVREVAEFLMQQDDS